MAKITLGEVLKLAKEAEGKIGELRNLRDEVSTISYALNEDPVQPEASVEELTTEINVLSAKVRYLRQMVAAMNLKTATDYKLNEHEITLAEALILLGQMLQDRRYIEKMAKRRPKTRDTDFQGNVEYTETTYDLDGMKKQLKSLDSDIRKLRITIDKANINTEVDIPDEVLE